jgi:hypothetical protein
MMLCPSSAETASRCECVIEWKEVKGIIPPQKGFLVIDDTTLDKPYAQDMSLVYRQWSGKHHDVVMVSLSSHCSGQMDIS